LYTDITSRDEQLLIRLFFFVKEKKQNFEGGGWGGLNLKLIFCFMETTHEQLHLGKLSLV
jgi:hypothetical protein